MLQKYGKFIVSFLFAVGIAVWQGASGDRHLDAREWTVVMLAFGNAATVYIVPLVPQYPWAKTAAGAIIAAATALSAVILGGLTYDELTIVGLAVLQALGIKLAPAESDNGTAVSSGFADR